MMRGMGLVGVLFFVVEAGGGHFFADASFFEECFLFFLDESSQEIVFLVYEGYGNVGYGFIAA